jgi:hypothetical protein
MAGTILPGDGELRLGPMRLPAGRRFTPFEHDEPVAWLATGTVPDPGLVWSARSREREARRAEAPFPGLAPATDGSLSSAARMAALRSIRPARIGLIAGRRPADVLPAVGWTCFDDPA